jgi:hypothetical protein
MVSHGVIPELFLDGGCVMNRKQLTLSFVLCKRLNNKLDIKGMPHIENLADDLASGVTLIQLLVSMRNKTQPG